MTIEPGVDPIDDTEEGEYLSLFEPDVTEAEVAVVSRVLTTARLDDGHITASFEKAFAAYVGREHAVAVSHGTLAMLLTLKAYGIGADDEVIASPYGWHQAVHAVALAGAVPVFSDIDYWQHTLNPAKAAQKVTDKTRAIIGSNTNGHPADWAALRALASEKNLILIEDSTEAVGSTFQGKPVGSFGDAAVFDFSEPGALIAGGGAMIVTDDRHLAHELRYLRHREHEHRYTVVITRTLPWQAGLSNLNAALGQVQLRRLPEILDRREEVVQFYEQAMASFEGIKPPYRGVGATRVCPMAYVAHLGTRFDHSHRKSVLEDLMTHAIESCDYGQPLVHQQYYAERGWGRAKCPIVDKTTDRAVMLPFHHKLTQEQVRFIVDTFKDATVNIGAGAAIY
ncbi:MAG TPA: DegT/DnrJ/EryC1/StrS family aminotransferase [Azospirillaceae bacterium]|nr:DegT/DnrJ/EryC1/StrS family aminotransferase [Azospirillaceae bacterium]